MPYPVRMQDRFPPGSFERQDESPDGEFYGEPRLVQHIDENAIAAVGEAYRRLLPPNGEYMDLMSSWVSHLPDDLPAGRLVGLGMNEVELRQNPRLDEYVVHDINLDPRPPFEDNRFDAVLLAVSVQYLTRPIDVFSEIGRVLKPGAPLVVSYSNRCFPTKAVRIWQALDDREKGVLVAAYIRGAEAFDQPDLYDLTPKTAYYTDPLYIMTARKRSGD
jgi:hypothetical protein